MMSREARLRKHGYGHLVDNRPTFLSDCSWGRNGMSEEVFADTICPACSHRVECDSYFQSLIVALRAS